MSSWLTDDAREIVSARRADLPVRIWNRLHLELELMIAAVSAFLIAVTGLVHLFNLSCSFRVSGVVRNPFASHLSRAPEPTRGTMPR
jgi:hypothetical protein